MSSKYPMQCAVCSGAINPAQRSRRPQLKDLCRRCLALPQQPISQAMLRSIFNYDPDTGRLTYARNFPGRKAGETATYDGGEGYLNVYLGRNHRAHRVIWMLVTGDDPECIDHINHDRSDNRLCNLRNTTMRENFRNVTASRSNKLGVPGVRRVTGRNNYRAEVMIDGKTLHLGVFDDPAEAGQAYRNAIERLGFHKNHAKR